MLGGGVSTSEGFYTQVCTALAKNTDYVASGINGELQSRIQLYKQPNCAFACGSFRAKELKLQFLSMHITSHQSDKNVYVGDFDFLGKTIRAWLKPHIDAGKAQPGKASQEEPVHFMPPAWFVETTAREKDVNFEISWTMDKATGVMVPVGTNIVPLSNGDRLYRLQMPYGACPSDVGKAIEKEKRQQRKPSRKGKLRRRARLSPRRARSRHDPVGPLGAIRLFRHLINA